MSIIYDALKKVENANKETQLPAEQGICAQAVALEMPASPIPRAKEQLACAQPRANTTLLPALLVLACLAVFAAYVLLPAQGKQAAAGKKAALPSRAFTGGTQLVLNGVFFSGPDAYGLINNQIVKTGDQIAGATVKKITVTDVELETADAKVIKLFTPE